MASYHNANKRVGLTIGPRDTKNGSQAEQKAAHVEVLLRRLYAKVDELESVCKEEKEFHALLKRKGRKTIPKYDSQLMPRVIASQQRCAESAFNNLDAYKWNLRSSGRKSSLTLPVKTVLVPDKSSNGDFVGNRADNQWNSQVISAASVKSSDLSPVHRDSSTGGKDNSWYGSLDRNMKKKKRGYLDKNRRHTKTVGSLAGLNVENIDMLQPDEQYTFGLPTVEAKFSVEAPILESVAPAVLANPAILVSPNTTANTCIPERRDRVNWQLAPSHSYTRSQTVPIFPGVSTEREPPPRWFDSSVDTVDSVLGSTEVLIPPYNENVNTGATDFNFNRLAISSPTEASERSSRSSENGDSKASFVNESSKPFEMADYYKYSMKYRSQKKEKMSSGKQDVPKIQRIDGVSNLRTEATLQPGRVDQVDGRDHQYLPETQPQPSVNNTLDAVENGDHTPVPKLPPKLRPITNGGSTLTNNRLPPRLKPTVTDFANGNAGDSSQAAWIQTTPTIV